MKKKLSLTEHLFQAVKNSDNPKSINKLLEKGADIEAQDENGKTPLHRAAEEGRLNTVNVLINALKAKGANIDAVNKSGATALMRPCRYGKRTHNSRSK
jgi:ankyrin repeat protein